MIASRPAVRFAFRLFVGSVAALGGAALLVGTADAQNTKAAGDADRLQGTWRGWVVFGKGENPNQGPVQLEITVKGDRITGKHLGGMGGQNPDLGEGTYKLGAAGNVRTIDAVGVAGQSKNRTFLGIYAIEGDTLKWCSGNGPQTPRPAEFVTRKANYYMILKKQR